MPKRVLSAAFLAAIMIVSTGAGAEMGAFQMDATILGGFVGGPLPAGALTLHPFAFEPSNPDARNDIRSLFGTATRYCEATQCNLAARVELPSGVVVHRLELDAMDWGDGHVSAALYRCPLGQISCVNTANLATSGSSGPTHIGVDLTTPLTIDNRNNYYYVSAVIVRGSGQSTYSRLIATRLVFDRTANVLSKDTLAIHPFAFEPYGSDWNQVVGVKRSCLVANCDLMAPVELPTGSLLTKLWLDAYDAGDGEVTIFFERCPIGTHDMEIIAMAETIGSPGQVEIPVTFTPEMVDNENYTYHVRADIRGPGPDFRLDGARVVFKTAPSQRFFETLAINPYAFERMEPEDVLVGWIGGDRYCADVSCWLASPVELPSGSVVSRLELDAFDQGGGMVLAGLEKCENASGSCYGLAEVETVGAPFQVQLGVDLLIPEIIDNSTFSYRIVVFLSGGNSATRLSGVRLVYTPIRVFHDGFENGNTAVWSDAVP